MSSSFMSVGPTTLGVDHNLVRARVHDGGVDTARLPFAISSAWTSPRSSPPPRERIMPSCENRAKRGVAPRPDIGDETRVDGLARLNAIPSSTATSRQLLAPPALKVRPRARPFKVEPADARREPQHTARGEHVKVVP